MTGVGLGEWSISKVPSQAAGSPTSPTWLTPLSSGRLDYVSVSEWVVIVVFVIAGLGLRWMGLGGRGWAGRRRWPRRPADVEACDVWRGSFGGRACHGLLALGSDHCSGKRW
jgi:hypothetical protein